MFIRAIADSIRNLQAKLCRRIIKNWLFDNVFITCQDVPFFLIVFMCSKISQSFAFKDPGLFDVKSIRNIPLFSFLVKKRSNRSTRNVYAVLSIFQFLNFEFRSLHLSIAIVMVSNSISLKELYISFKM